MVAKKLEQRSTVRQQTRKLSATDRRQAILTAAIPLFARHGRAGTTTKEIAKVAGVSEALLYRHFEGKEALYSELENHCVQAGQIASRLLEKARPSTATLVKGVAVLVHAVFLGIGDREAHENTKRLVTLSLLEDGCFAKSFLNRHVEPWIDVLGESLIAAQASGDIVPNVSVGKAELWFSHHLANTLHLMHLPAKEVVQYGTSPQKLADDAIRFLLRGFGLKETAINRYYDPLRFNQVLERLAK